MTFDVRLDELGVLTNGRTSGSSIIIARDGDRELSWGGASNAGESRAIATLRLGFLSITVDEGVAGRARLKALRDTFYVKEPRVEAAPEDRRDAASAAAGAEDFVLAGTIDPMVLFDMITNDIVKAYANAMTPERLADLLRIVPRQTQNAHADGYRRGRSDAKAELREWLNVPSASFDE